MLEVLELDTPRLRLRQWRAADREPFARLNADPEVMAFFPAALTRTESDALAGRCEALIAERGWGVWAVEHRAAHGFIGCVGLHVPDDALPFSPCVEILWRLVRAHWGEGFAAEAARAALHAGFDVLELPEIVAFTVPANRRSRALMERLHMHQAADTFEHPGVAPGSPLRQHCLYRLTRAQWLARREARDPATG